MVQQGVVKIMELTKFGHKHEYRFRFNTYQLKTARITGSKVYLSTRQSEKNCRLTMPDTLCVSSCNTDLVKITNNQCRYVQPASVLRKASGPFSISFTHYSCRNGTIIIDKIPTLNVIEEIVNKASNKEIFVKLGQSFRSIFDKKSQAHTAARAV